MRSPLARPKSPPEAAVARKASSRLCVALKTMPPTTAEQANTEPTERSIPPEMMTKVIPAPMTAMTAV